MFCFEKGKNASSGHRAPPSKLPEGQEGSQTLSAVEGFNPSDESFANNVPRV